MDLGFVGLEPESGGDDDGREEAEAKGDEVEEGELDIRVKEGGADQRRDQCAEPVCAAT